MIIHVETVGPFQENCYIIGDEATNTGAIIDPGDEADRIIRRAESTGLQFRFILNTHAHLDHVCAVDAVKTRFGIPFYLHPEDEFLLARLPQQAAMFGLASPKVPKVDFYFKTPSEIQLGEKTLRIFHAPGHSPGSVCFYSPVDGLVLGGDVLFNGSIGRTDLPGGDFDVLIHSIRSQLFTLPDATIVYPGHGPETTIGFEKKFNPFLNNEQHFA